MGFGLALSQAIAFRPSELRRLEPEHVLVPTACVGAFVIRLGADVGTQVKREQFALSLDRSGVDSSTVALGHFTRGKAFPFQLQQLQFRHQSSREIT